MPSQRLNKTYRPQELKNAIAAMQAAGVTNPAETIIKLHKAGYRVVYVGCTRPEVGLTHNRKCHTSAR